MLHRLILTLSLIVSFGFAQIGAITHELSHYADATALGQQQSLTQQNPDAQSFNKNNKNPQAPHNPVCEKCVSYAELGHVISGSHIALVTVVASHLFINSDRTTLSLLKPRNYSARAPPALI